MYSDILMIFVLWYLLRRYSYNKGYKNGDYNGYRRYHYNQICIACKSLDNCKNPDGYNGNGYCKWED